MAMRPHLTRHASQDVTLLGDSRRPGGVTLAFTERTGGVSEPPHASLNLGDACGDDEASVVANRRRLLAALGIGGLEGRLVNPRQVHGSTVVTITSGSDEALRDARRAARDGADAVVCTARDVPVLLCVADCVPVVIVAPQAFAVIHSGWRGTEARICGRALDALLEASGASADELLCYLGPHISADDYEVSPELAASFARSFGPEVAPDATHLDLGRAIRKTLREAGVPDEAILDECPSTASCTERFFSYRAEAGSCGRCGAIAVISDRAGYGGGGEPR